MKTKTLFKIIVDFMMLISLLALMAYELIGAAAHEWIGTGMFALIIVHNILNRKWWRGLLNGKYTLVRTVRTIIIFLVSIGMIMQMVSGVIMSRYVFTFLPINGGMAFARTVHLVLAYWSLALMSVHLGFHGSMLMGIAKKAARIKEPSRSRTIGLRIVALSASAYGIYAFIGRGIGSYILLKNQFAFFDFNEPLIFFSLTTLRLLLCLSALVIISCNGSHGFRKRETLLNEPPLHACQLYCAVFRH